MNDRPRSTIPAAPSATQDTTRQAGPSDWDLLRRYEPVIRFTRGEEYFPTAAESYVRSCSLWVHHPDGTDTRLVPEGQLTLEKLAEPRPAEFGAVHYLKFIEPPNIAELTTLLLQGGLQGLRKRAPGDGFRARLGRLARVGYGSRLLDALFSLTLLLRGRVPGDTAAAARIIVRQLRERDGRYVYYGRVVREHGWIALQYWFFYPFNNWRTGFYGANDHEADWEMVTVYLYEEPDGRLAPNWVAFASHDYHGDDLRRHWNDREELILEDGHPVVYVGAGSHASYFRRGEYLTAIEIRYLTPAVRAINYLRTVWVRFLRQFGTEAPLTQMPVFRIPFVDYARGDGLSVGPGQAHEWTPVPLDPVPEWVKQYRGLWGLHARDPLSGENAPSGPMYNRDGSVRTSWDNPAGWAGLDKVPTPPAERQLLEQHREALEARRRELDAAIADQSRKLQTLGVELTALKGHPHLKSRHDGIQLELRALGAQVAQLRWERAQGGALLEALSLRAARLEAGEPDDRRAHISRLAVPATEARLRMSRWVEIWAAGSIGLMLIGLVALLVFAERYLVSGSLAMVGAFIVIEAVFRRQLAGLISGLTIALAVVGALVLLYEYFWAIIVLGVLAAALHLLWENLRELRG